MATCPAPLVSALIPAAPTRVQRVIILSEIRLPGLAYCQGILQGGVDQHQVAMVRFLNSLFYLI